MSDQKDTSTRTAGISTLGLLGVLFVGLKLTGYISWPWLWVTAPFWAPAAAVIAILAVLLVLIGILKLLELILGAIERRQRSR